MIELLSFCTIFLLILNSEDFSKNALAVLSLLVAASLWTTYLYQPVVYIGYAAVVGLGLSYHYKNNNPLLKLEYLPLAALLSVAPLSWLPLLMIVATTFSKLSLGKYRYVLTTLLLVVGVLSMTLALSIPVISVAILIVSILASFYYGWNRYRSLAVLWTIIAYRHVVFVPNNLRIATLVILMLPFSLLLLNAWAEDNERSIKGDLERFGTIVVLASGLLYGELGFWPLLIAWQSFEVLLFHKSSRDEGPLFSLPWQAVAGLILIPVSPLMLYLCAGKDSIELILGLIFSILANITLWRWIKLKEKCEVEIHFDLTRVIALVFFLLMIISGTILSFNASKTGMFIYVALAIVFILIFIVLSLDEKILSLSFRSRLALSGRKIRMKNTFKQDDFYKESSFSVWDVLNNLAGSLLVICTDFESLIARTLAVSVLVLILLFITLGGSNV